MRMLNWPRRSPFNASKKSRQSRQVFAEIAASSRSSLTWALRSKPESALTRFPEAKSCVG
jgi:hypothetical protein